MRLVSFYPERGRNAGFSSGTYCIVGFSSEPSEVIQQGITGKELLFSLHA